MNFKSFQKTVSFFALVFAFVINTSIYSQSITEPNLNVSIACPNSGKNPFNKFTATSDIVAGSFPSGTIFALQLSNKNGSFGSNTINIASTEVVADSVTFVDFSFPETDGSGEPLASETYRLRVIAEGTSVISQRSNSFSAYFFDGTQFRVSPTNALCIIGGTLTAQNNTLKSYRWFRNGILIPSENESTFTPTTTGNYFYTPDFGACGAFLNDEIRSNEVRVSNTTPISISIAASGPTTICAAETVTLQSDVVDSSLAYQWVKIDGTNVINLDGENGTSITLTGLEIEGNYRIEVADSTLNLSNRCASQSNEIFIDVLNPSIEITSDLNIVDIPGQDEVLMAKVTGNDTVITWAKNGVDIPNSNVLNLTATGAGTYTAKVIDNASSCAVKEVEAKDAITIREITSLTAVIKASDENFDNCSLSQVTLSITEVLFDGSMSLDPSNFNDLNIEWLRDAMPTGNTTASLLLNDAGDNGRYQVRISFSGLEFVTADDEALNVALNISSLSITQPPADLTFGAPVELSLELSPALQDLVDVGSLQLQWVQIGLAGNRDLDDGNKSTFLVTDPGQYSVRVSLAGCETALLNPITLAVGSNVVPNVLSLNSDPLNNDWILPSDMTLNPDIKVDIYTSSGKLHYSSSNQMDGYNGNWPNKSDSKLKETIYYYVISKGSSPLKQGSITIIR